MITFPVRGLILTTSDVITDFWRRTMGPWDAMTGPPPEVERYEMEFSFYRDRKYISRNAYLPRFCWPIAFLGWTEGFALEVNFKRYM